MLIRQLAQKTKPVLAGTLHLLFPPRCSCCSELVDEQGSLCGACWSKIRFIEAPYCPRCGHPFDYAVGEGMLCGRCIESPPSFTAARSVVCYDEHSKALILSLKYADRTEHVPSLARWLWRVGQGLADSCDIIVPVPMHARRLVTRRFNQAVLLGRSLEKLSNIPMMPDALVRTRHTAPQSGLTRTQRKDNVKNAFAASKRHSARISGKRILLVDDVMTTMATLEHCAKALLQAGADEVRVLTVARTVQAD